MRSDDVRWELRPGEPDYPKLLAATQDPPKVLYGMGDPARLSPGLGIVGARRATPYGLWAADRFASVAAAAGVTVVSGAAVGCDASAGRAAVAAGGPSVAVLGCGADVVYPRSSKLLLERTIERGVIVSEAPWGAPPTRWAFRKRNRIIAGLSRALLVVEAGLPSGTFSTAEYALSAGRDLLIVPGSIRAPECRGTNRLWRDGAIPLTEVSDLPGYLEMLGLSGHGRTDAGGLASNSDDLVQARGDAILRAVVGDPMTPDDIAWCLGLDAREVIIRLSQLEGRGLVARYPDGRYGTAR